VIVLAVAAVVLLVLVLSAPVLDRLAATRAERRASDYLTEPLGAPATVRVRDRPFLTQLGRGVYRNIEVVGGVRLGELTGTLAAHLTNVHLPFRELLGRRTREVACERVEGRIVLPYDQLARVARIPGLTLAFSGERLVAAAALPVPGLNQLVSIRGEAVLSRAGAGPVWRRINGVSVVGLPVPSILLSQLLPTLNVPIPLPALPYGLHIDELRPTANGLVVDGSAEAVVFRRVRQDDAA
jgi:hypothetical protein